MENIKKSLFIEQTEQIHLFIILYMNKILIHLTNLRTSYIHDQLCDTVILYIRRSGFNIEKMNGQTLLAACVNNQISI